MFQFWALLVALPLVRSDVARGLQGECDTDGMSVLQISKHLASNRARVPTGIARGLTALLVVGTDPDEPLYYVDSEVNESLVYWGYTVTLLRDKDVDVEICEQYDAMLISASVSAAAVGDRTNKCTKPQLIWEVVIYSRNGMAGPSTGDAWITSKWWNTHRLDVWEERGYWPQAPTGRDIVITDQAAGSPEAAGRSGTVPFYFADDLGFNWVNIDRLGPGADVVAILPPGSTKDWPLETAPRVHKAVLFYYEKGAELFSGEKSPAFRMAFPPYHFSYGAQPTCGPELDAFGSCDVCNQDCKTKEQAIELDANVPFGSLSLDGLDLLDSAILALITRAGVFLEIEKHSNVLSESVVHPPA